MGKYVGIRAGTIYGLVDPRSGVIRYVGKTVDADPTYRIARHVHESSRRQDTYKQRWVYKLTQLGLEPGLTILEQDDWTSSELDDAERRWIAIAKKLVGPLLTNFAEGGEGGWDHVNSEMRRVGSWRTDPQRIARHAKVMSAVQLKSYADDPTRALRQGAILREKYRRRYAENPVYCTRCRDQLPYEQRKYKRCDSCRPCKA